MGLTWSDPPTNSGIMDFNCNFPAKIAQQPRDQNHKQFERPNLLNPNWNLQRFCWIKSPLGKGKRQQCRDEFAKGQILLRGIFCSRKNFAKGHVLLREKFCLRTNFATGKILLREICA